MNMPEQRTPYMGSPFKEVDKNSENTLPVECNECRKDITGVFVRIKDKNLHVECFKCATCGSSLKNVGYFNINNKLYCDIHAKMVPKQIPVQTPNSEPVTVSPISQPSPGSFNTIPTIFKDVQSPRTNALSPIPFHAPKAPSHVNAPKIQTPSKVFTNTTPYEAPKQTPAPPTFASGYNQVQTDEPKKSINSQPRLPFLKPKPSTGSVLSTVTSKSLTTVSSQCPTLSNQSVSRSLNQCKQILSESISTQMLIESSKKERTHSPPQKEETIIPDIPHEIRSLLPPNNNIQSISPTRFVVFPPEIPAEYRIYCRSKTSSPQPKREINVETKSEHVISSLAREVDHTISHSTLERFESNNNRNFNENENIKTSTSDIVTTHCHEIKNETTLDCTNSSSIHSIETKFSQSTNSLEIIEPNHDQEFCEPENTMIKTNNFSQEQPISNTANTEPIIESKLQLNLVEDDNIIESPMVAALKIAPERSYSPLPTFEDASELISKQIEPSIEPMTMADALVTAPDRSYKLPESNIKRPVGNNPVKYMHGYNNKKPVEPLLMTKSLIYTPTSAVDSEEEQIASLGLKSFPPISDELKLSTASEYSERTESNFENVEELVFLKPEIEELLNEEKDVVEPVVESISKHPFTASGLHEPSDIPRYQRSIPENPHRATNSDKSSGKLIGPGIQDKVSSFTPKVSNEDTSFPIQKPNEPSLVNSSSKNSVSIIYTSSNSEPNSSNYTPVDPILKSHISPESSKDSITLRPHISETNNTLEEPVTPTFKSSLPAAFLSKKLTCLIKKQQPECIPTPIPIPDIGGQPTGRAGVSAGLTAPRRGRGVLNPQNLTPGAREPLCGQCNLYIRGPFITALGKIWCPEHFVCTNEKCKRPLQDIGFVEETNGLYCEYCFEQYLAPVCHKCSKKIKGDCLNAIGKQFHPECFNCAYCGKLFGNSPFFLEDSLPYCENDWNELFTTKCIACGFPIEAGDRWVEALDNNYHSPCFNCSKCKTNLEGQSFFAKGGRPYCKSHAR